MKHNDPQSPVVTKKTCPDCKGRGWIGILVRKPRRAFSVRMLKYHCRLPDNKES